MTDTDGLGWGFHDQLACFFGGLNPNENDID